MYKYLILLFSLSVFHLNSLGQTDTAVTYKYWLYVCESSDKNKCYIRSQYESKNGAEIKIWVKHSVPLQTIKNKKYKDSYGLELYIFDCSNKMFKVLKSVLVNKSCAIKLFV